MRSVWKSNFRLAAAIAIVALPFAGRAAASDWQITRLDEGGIGKFSSMKADKSGNLHLVYVMDDGNHYPVKYAFWDHKLKRWFVMTVATGGAVCSITLDSKQHPHIAWIDWGSMPGAKLHYAYWDGTAWKAQPVPLDAEIIAYYDSIALDAQDRPSISFYEYTGPNGTSFRVRQRVVQWNGKYWEVRTVDGQNQSGKFNAMGIDAQGHLHLAYANVNGTTAGVRYGFWDGKSWKLEIVEGLPELRAYVGYGLDLVMDPGGDPHISYSRYSEPYSVKYAVRRKGQWQIETVDRLVGVGYPDRNGITLDDSGRPWISYFDSGLGTLKVARRQDDKWVTETVDGNGVGFTSSVAVSQGLLWVAYADEGGNGFKVAYRPLESAKPVITAGSIPGRPAKP